MAKRRKEDLSLAIFFISWSSRKLRAMRKVLD